VPKVEKAYLRGIDSAHAVPRSSLIRHRSLIV
jgi:hypothetical protein